MATTLTRPSILLAGAAPVEAQQEGFVRVPPPPPEWQPAAKAIRDTGIADLIFVEAHAAGTLLHVRFRPGVTFDEKNGFDLYGIVAGVLGDGWGIRVVKYLLGGDEALALVVPPQGA